MSKKLRLLSVFLTLAVVFGSLCIPASAISFTVGETIGTGTVSTAVNKPLTSDSAVTYAKAIYTDSADHTQAVHAIEFNPKTSDYMPYVYSKWTGTGCDVLRSAQQAESQFGADVIAGLNATFFSMDTGSTYAGFWVHDGRLAQASAGTQSDIITFSTDGTIKVVNSKLDYKLYINGSEITYGGSSSIAHINKKSLKTNVSDKFYYWDTECGTNTDSVIKGTEVVCKKLDHGELIIGGTLKGKVTEIRKNTYYQPVAEDEFVLYLKNGSSLMSKIESLTVDSIVELSVIETIESAKPYTEKANAAIAAQYKVIDNGKYAPGSDTLSLDHYNARAQRCLLGFKEDGTVVFMSTAGRDQKENDNAYGLTIPQLGEIALQNGCVTAYNLDGGGSTQMIISVNGGDFEYAHMSLENKDKETGIYKGRLVANCIYVVKKQSSKNSDGVKAALSALIEESKNSTLQKINTKSMDGDYTRVYMKLKSLLSATVKEGSGIKLENGLATGIKDNTTVTALESKFNGTIVVKDAQGNVITGNKLIGTGATINTGANEYKVVVKGDIDGDGKVDSVDAMLLKRGIIGSLTLTDVEKKAGAIDSSTVPTSVDYMLLKKYILGNLDIYAI
jgi:exopolysaccharide biosynthesis protein